MPDLTFKGLPTTPEQREFFESIGLFFASSQLCPLSDTAEEAWRPSWVGAGDKERIIIRYNRGAASIKQEGEYVREEFLLVQWALFPEVGIQHFGGEIQNLVVRRARFLNFNLGNCTGEDIIEALRQLAKSKEEKQ